VSKKNKLYRFAENETFDNMFQLAYEDVIDGFELRDNWTSNFFKNNNNLIIELGCGKGEYTTGLAQMFPANNFIGIDIKGARIWRGLVTSDDRSLKNVAFIRSRINLIEYFFGNNEVSEIWITFPDPHPSRIKEKRRLTSPQFLNRYYKILKTDGVIHLKTDNIIFFEYTMDVIRDHGHDLLYTTYDVYGEENDKALTQIQTFYEKKWLNRGTKIKYLKFKLIPL
jgi:tRNA (guanine-N7-)-methyltransferase|tara:strand:+ start:1557 stop:2231 length:675 start_codon:yes stop_codon:yes gene_type:complete